MRIDKYIKVSRLSKKRDDAKKLALNERIFINDKIAKPSSEVNVKDIVKIVFGNRIITFEVLEIRQSASKEQAFGMYRIIEEIKNN